MVCTSGFGKIAVDHPQKLWKIGYAFEYPLRSRGCSNAWCFSKLVSGFTSYNKKKHPIFKIYHPPSGGGIFLNIQLGKNAIVMSITTPRRGVVIDITSFFLPYDRYRPPSQFFVRKQQWSLAFYKMVGGIMHSCCHAFCHPHIGHQITKHANGFIPICMLSGFLSCFGGGFVDGMMHFSTPNRQSV